MTLWRPGMRVTAARMNSETMPWTPLDELGTWASIAAPHDPMPPRMRKLDDAGTPVWELEGEIEIPSLPTDEIAIVFTFGPDHHPTRGHRFACGWNTSSFYPPWARFQPSGELATGFPAAASTGGTTRMSLAGVRLTNP